MVYESPQLLHFQSNSIAAPSQKHSLHNPDKNGSTTKNNKSQENVMSIHNALLCVYGGAERNRTAVLKVI